MAAPVRVTRREREVTSFWYPTWLAQPAALVPNSKLLDCPPHDIDIKAMPGRSERLRSRHHSHFHAVAEERLQSGRSDQAQKRPDTKIGFVGAHAAVLPTETLKASSAIDWVGAQGI